MNAIRDWYLARSRREQVMLGIMTLIAVPILFWLLVIGPVMGMHDDARNGYLAASDRYGRIVALAEMIDEGAAGTNAPPLSQPLGDFVAASADQAGFMLSSNQPDGAGRTAISIAQAQPDAALGWMAQLRTAGVRIETVRMTETGEGGVAIDLTLARAAQ